MNLGRLDYVIRTGWLKTAFRARAFMIVGNAMFQFRRPLRLWQKARLDTRLLFWDDKWLFFEHTLFHSGHVLARGIVKVLFRAGFGKMRPRDIMTDAQRAVQAPVLPVSVETFLAAERSIQFSEGQSKS